MTTLPPDPTLDEMRDHVAPLLGHHAGFDGWRPAAIASAAQEAGLDPDIVALAFPGGVMDMIDAWFDSIDRGMADAQPPEKLDTMPVGARISALLETRLDILAPDREALRRALTLLAMPNNAVRAAKLSWRAADRIWRVAGDTATDFNHYSKRMTLSAIYAATLVVFLDDESVGQADTRAFLARRIAGIRRFEQAKAKLTRRDEPRLSLSRFIGRLRYPAV